MSILSNAAHKKLSRRSFLGGISALCVYSLAQAAGLSGSVTPQLGGGISGFDGGISSLSSPILRPFFIASAGNDGNDGKSPATAWATTGKVNAQTMLPGDAFFFNGGDTFTDATLTPAASGTAKNPIFFNSYGTGQAQISLSASVACSITDLSYISVNNLILIGALGTTQSGVSVSITTTQSNISLSGLVSSGFAANGILVSITGSGDLTGLTILSCTTHDNTKLFTTSGGSAGIYVRGVSGAQVRGTYNLHNVLISGCVSYNNTGILGAGNWTGSGICLFQCDSGTIQNCTAYINGANSNSAGGAVGIFLFDDKGVVVKYCESYKNSTSSGADGDGYDADGGCINCVFEYSYSHGNAGNGFQIFAYSDTVNVTGNFGTIVRYCVSEGDGLNSVAHQGGIGFQSASGTLSNPQIYGNTVFGSSTTGTGGCLVINGAVTGGFAANNIFYANGIACIVKDSAVSTIAFTGNNYFSNGAFSIQWSGTTYTSLATWQAATSQEEILGVNVALTVDPTLLAPGAGGTISPASLATLNAYQLLPGSPMINAGINLVTQYGIDIGTQDFYGNAISAAALSVGCTNSTNTTLTHAQTFIARTGAINYKHRQAYSDFINGLDTFGIFPKLDVCVLLAAQGSASALLNIISTSFTPVLHPGGASPAFTADRGYAGVDSSATVYIDTGFNPTVGTPNYKQDTASITISVENAVTASASGGAAIGSVNTGATAPFSQIWPRYSTGVTFYGANSSPASAGITNASSLARFMAIRSGGNVIHGYKNNADVGLANTTDAAPLNQNFYVLAKNNGGVPSAGSACQISSYSIGAMNDNDAANFDTLLTAYLTAVGA